MIEKTILLRCEPDRAFALFTERASDWWPAELRHTGDPRSRIAMLADGRFWEAGSDGSEVELGLVTGWRPPHQLTLDFYPGTDALHPTEVEVRFSAEDGGTRVVVTHGPKAVSDERWATGAPRFERSWDLVLPALALAAESSS